MNVYIGQNIGQNTKNHIGQNTKNERLYRPKHKKNRPKHKK